jgi:polysaccharide pyruvyl transferase WcaK-like protein
LDALLEKMAQHMAKNRIVLFGHFGVGNLGNDTTLESVILNIRRYKPDAQITCVCRGPKVISDKYNIDAVPVDIGEDRRPGEASPAKPNPLTRLLLRVIDELKFWFRHGAWFRDVDRFLIIGTGAIYDGTAPPWNVPYDTFKWCAAARLGGASVMFVSVGAGPVYHPASRFLFLRALKMAHYRSYRDMASFHFLKSIGFDTSGDSLYPDLVFSLPMPDVSGIAPSSETPKMVGLGVMSYYGEHYDIVKGQPIYKEYVKKLKDIVRWLLENGYHVRLLTGDLENDRQPADELLDFVSREGQLDWKARIIAAPITSVEELNAQVLQTDIVVASRFHNLVSALMAGRPALSISYHEKNDALMAEFGLVENCQPIETLDVDRLVGQLQSLILNANEVSTRIQGKVNEYRRRLDEQYQNILFSKRGSEIRGVHTLVDRRTFFEMNGVPTQDGMLWKTREEALNAPTGDIKLAHCRSCGYIGNLMFDPDKIRYDQDYTFSMFFSPTFREFLTGVASRLIERYDIRNKLVLEVACGEGDFLRLLCEMGGNRGLGVDPVSTTHTEQAGGMTVEFIRDLYTEKYADQPADLICCRQALDQLPNPKSMVEVIRDNIGSRRNTVVYIEVPNAASIFEDLLIRNIMYEKSSWFTVDSLSMLFKHSGFEVLSASPCYDNDQYIGLEAGPAPEGTAAAYGKCESLERFATAIDTFTRRHDEKISKWQVTLDGYRQSGKKMIAWGSGAGGVNFLSTLKIRDEIPYIIDINPNRQGKFMPLTGQEVMPGEFIREYKPDTVVITNATYENEIKQTVRDLGLDCDFWVI